MQLLCALLLLTTTAHSQDGQLTKFNSAVSINDEVYDILRAPSASSAVVVVETERLLQTTQLDTAMSALGGIAALLDTAYFAAKATGPQHTDIQIQIREVGVDMAKLVRAFREAILDFNNAASSAVEDLQLAYEYLANGLEQMAADNLEDIAQDAAKIKESCVTVKKQFEKKWEQVEEILKKVNDVVASETLKADDKEDADITEEDLKYEEEDASGDLARELEEELKKQNFQVDLVGSFKVILDLASSFAHIKIPDFLGKTPLEQKKEFTQQRYEEEMKKKAKSQQERLKINEKMQQFAKDVLKASQEKEQLVTVQKGLHHAAEAIKAISVSLLKNIDFFARMEKHVRSLSSEKMKKGIEALSAQSLEVRHGVWGSAPFKKGVVLYYARWLAVGSVAGKYDTSLIQVQEDLYKVMQENPTYEEAKLRLKGEAAQLLEKLEKEEAEIKASVSSSATYPVKTEL